MDTIGRIPAPRALPLVSAVWLVSVLIALPSAQSTPPVPAPPQAAVAGHPHEGVPLFAPSDTCVACHNNLVAPTGEDVSIGTAWRSTIMANSARDPYWQASVRRETIDHPSHSAGIQDECAACHMPMAQKTARAAGAAGEVFAHLPVAHGSSDADRLAADGVSCTVCHQISGETLGTRASFNGNFLMRPTRADGVRDVLGPFAVDRGRRTIMRSVTGFEQVEAPHVRQSELCATCHTLITEAYGPDGRVVGSLPEQMNYQEWQHSALRDEGRSCQSCHMPRADGPIRVASVLGDYRDGLSRHTFVGGNAFMLRLMNRFRVPLGLEALPAELEATARATERQLQEDTATIAVSRPSLAGTTLGFDVEVRNLTGHKYPTGYPSRRTWLHVTVRDGMGRAVFESGRITAAGLIEGNDNDEDASRFEPHHDRITRADEVQIYEAILGDPGGRTTTGLLSAVRYLKDNRLLPRGFDKATADPLIGVYGAAAGDTDFTGGGDRVRYDIPMPDARGPFAVEVELRYQPIGYRWAHNLESYRAAEPAAFVGYYDAVAERASTVVRRTSATVGP
jgi:hypothetical protein